MLKQRSKRDRERERGGGERKANMLLVFCMITSTILFSSVRFCKLHILNKIYCFIQMLIFEVNFS
jgi:hypothetical protein